MLVLVFADLVTRVLFFRNDYPQTHAVAIVAMALYCGVIPFGWLYLSERFFYAHEDARTPFFIQCLVTTISQTGALIGATLDPRHTAIAIGIAQSIAYATGAIIGFTLIRRRLGRLGLGGAHGIPAPARPGDRVGRPAVVGAAGARARSARPGSGARPAGPARGRTGAPAPLARGAHLLRVPEVGELVSPCAASAPARLSRLRLL